MPVIKIDPAQRFQAVEGFGYTLTGASAQLIQQLSPGVRDSLLQELFGSAPNSLQISYLRLSLGASDLSVSVFSYDDLPPGQTDESLSKFSLSQDTTYLIPLLKDILRINPNLKIMASPWSPPVWMKSNGNSMGGSLLPKYYPAFARYFVKYIQAMAAAGIRIDAVTLQNEPHHGGNNPSMVMEPGEQADFVKNHLGPAFKEAGISTKILVWDHNCDEPDYPIAVLNDSLAKTYVHGSAFHLYAGDVSALSKVHEAHPDRALYFTEQWTGSKGTFDGDFQWHVKNVIIGAMRNHSRTALEWNLANDPAFSLHTPGGCTECKGALTIGGDKISRNVSYYIVAHASRFVPPGSVRIGSQAVESLPNVAFLTPDGRTVSIVLNDSNKTVSFQINANNQFLAAQLGPGMAGTWRW